MKLIHENCTNIRGLGSFVFFSWGSTLGDWDQNFDDSVFELDLVANNFFIWKNRDLHKYVRCVSLLVYTCVRVHVCGLLKANLADNLVDISRIVLAWSESSRVESSHGKGHLFRTLARQSLKYPRRKPLSQSDRYSSPNVFVFTIKELTKRACWEISKNLWPN